MAVPFIDLKPTVARLRDAVFVGWQDVYDKQQFVQPPLVTALEQRLAGVLAAPHVYCCANGTDALLLGLQAMGLERRRARVAVPDVTFWASYEAIVQVGAVPVLLDIDPGDMHMSLNGLKAAHEEFHLDGVMLPHLFGFASGALDEIRTFCRSNGIRLLEDGAQCFGVKVGGRSIFSEADLATLSFYPAKVIGGCGDGGALLGRNQDAVARCRILGNHGRSTHYSYSCVGWNSRMGGLQAVFLNEMLGLAEEILSSRRQALDLYRQLLHASRIAERVEMVLPPSHIEGNGYLSVFMLRDRDPEVIRQKLQGLGIGAGRTYPETISMQACCAKDLRGSDLSQSAAFCRSVINLPIFGFITNDQVNEAFEAFERALLE